LEKGGDLIHSSAVLAAELGRVVSGGERPPEYALSFPAFLPQGLSDSEKAMVQKFLEMYPTYTTIMGRPSSTFAASEPSEEEPLVDRLHGLLTSVGEWPAEGFSKYISAQEKEELEKAKVVGDLLGNFVTANQVDGFPEDNPISRINDRFLGAKPRHIRRCALRARKGGALGVVIIAHGCAKAATLLSVINADCVTEAIIDEELAEEIVRLREEKLATD
jgi:hypothetical protein